jgi:hypothetical protein
MAILQELVGSNHLHIWLPVVSCEHPPPSTFFVELPEKNFHFVVTGIKKEVHFRVQSQDRIYSHSMCKVTIFQSSGLTSGSLHNNAQPIVARPNQ